MKEYAIKVEKVVMPTDGDPFDEANHADELLSRTMHDEGDGAAIVITVYALVRHLSALFQDRWMVRATITEGSRTLVIAGANGHPLLAGNHDMPMEPAVLYEQAMQSIADIFE